MAKLGITWDDAKDELKELTSSNYVKGPDTDRDFPEGDKLLGFKKLISGENIYIKLKIKYMENKSVVILSFHIDGY